MPFVYPFATQSAPVPETPDLAQVGGKALSLILMAQHGLPIPPGFVLSVTFFQPWLEAIQATPEWASVLSSAPEGLKTNCDAVKALAMGLQWDDEHRAVLREALQDLRTEGKPLLLAVRSSSPQEDLEGASFAGGYETVLGVLEEGLEDAVRRSFASAFDERVFLYKREHGFAVDAPRMAVIVQQQVAAKAAGVAFSLHPINNAYDEAVINANFGLGQSVVSGLVSPDSFTVDKVTRTILERQVGTKETSVWLAADGGTYEQPSNSRAQACLSDEQVLQLTDLLVTVEDQYGQPVDIEWAFAAGSLYLLQARPITAYVPLPEELQTAPGQAKRLYLDMTLATKGVPEPLSVMGTDYLAMQNDQATRNMLGQNVKLAVEEQTRVVAGGRLYVNLSNMIKMYGKKRAAAIYRVADVLSAEIIEGLDEGQYLPRKLPPAARRMLFGLIRQNVGTVGKVFRALWKPAQCRARWLEQEQRLRQDLHALAEAADSLSLHEFASRVTERWLSCTTQDLVPLAAVPEIARSRIKALFKKAPAEVRAKVAYLERALPENVTIEMGLAMARLAAFQELAECPSGQVFATRIEERSFSPQFLQAWDAFVQAHGFRCPGDADPAKPRPYERPAQLFGQLQAMAQDTGQHDPQGFLQTAIAEREQAYQELLQAALKMGRLRARQLQSWYSRLVLLGGYREVPRYYFSWVTDLFRRRVLAAARPLVESGRLDNVQQAFDLTIEQLDRAAVDPSLDLRALAEGNTRFLRRLRRVRRLPRVIDSRGKILRPPRREAAGGEWVGVSVSPGVVRGQAKVLHQPHEKPLLPGEILVARATDPGWTPLFLNAAGILLEVGGVLQHGAVVAREYGKPCVAGLDGVTEMLRDGQMIELDGASGVVRLV